MALWSLRVIFSHGGRSDPLPYIPLLNALDLAHIFAIIAVVSLWLAMRRAGLEQPRWLRGRFGIVAASGLVFLWLNAALLRTIHHWAGVPYGFDTMGSSVLVQASLSVFWAFLALSAMVYATRGARRAVWMTGAAQARGGRRGGSRPPAPPGRCGGRRPRWSCRSSPSPRRRGDPPPITST